MRDYEQRMARLRERNTREEAASAARRLQDRKARAQAGPSVAKLLRQLDLRSQRRKAEQQKQHWGTGPLKEWESEQQPYKVETPDPFEKE